ncbi:MAG: SDR family oxidoreductase [Clostridia bacterium]|nr:SDR family oxidoreductase [Clostridia bacterium]
MDLGLKDKVVIITGGAKGIGSGISQVFAKEGARLCVNYRRDEQACLAFIRSLETEFGAQVIGVQGDMGFEEEAQRVFDKTIEAFGQVDVLVNNAGYCPTVDITEMDLATWEEVQRSNLTSMFLLSRLMVRHLRARGAGGAIVNIASKAGVSSTTKGRTAYNSSKAGVIGFTKSLARDVTEDGIRVNAVLPGFVRSSRTALRLQEDPHAMDSRLERVPIHRLGEPEELGNMVAMLASEKTVLAVGSVVDMTGGLLL